MDRDLLRTTMASDQSAAMPMVQQVFGAYPTGGGSSTSKLIASRRIDALMYPGEHSLLKFAWADRAKEYLAETSCCACLPRAPKQRPPVGSGDVRQLRDFGPGLV